VAEADAAGRMRSGNMDSLPFESDGVGGSTSRRGGGEGGGGGGGGVHSVHATPRSSRGDVPPLSARREKKDAVSARARFGGGEAVSRTDSGRVRDRERDRARDNQRLTACA
jgi:hypothetical protein